MRLSRRDRARLRAIGVALSAYFLGRSILVRVIGAARLRAPRAQVYGLGDLTSIVDSGSAKEPRGSCDKLDSSCGLTYGSDQSQLIATR